MNFQLKYNFNEVETVYSDKEALYEADRCYQCKNPSCISGCPIKVNIPKFIYYIKKKKIKHSYYTILKSNLFPSICGRVCPQENQCEKKCILKNENKEIHIGKLEKYVSNKITHNDFINFLNKNKKNNCNMNIAIIGSGPSSITASFYLKIYGYNVTIYEALNDIGGVLLYGIPNFRLPKIILKNIENAMNRLDINIQKNYIIGQIKDIDTISKEYDAVFIGSGSGTPIFLNIEGEYLNNIYSANEYLMRINLLKSHNKKYDTPIIKGKNVIIIGGGNVAIDAARCALRMESENVTIIYRKGEEKLSALKKEIYYAKKEGVNFLYYTKPIRFIGNINNNVKFIECIKTKEIEQHNEKIYIDIKDSNFLIKSDLVIIAIGTNINLLVFKNSSLFLNKKYTLEKYLDENLQFKNTNIFFGGDIISKTSTVISAIEQGKKAAFSINEFLCTKNKK